MSGTVAWKGKKRKEPKKQKKSKKLKKLKKQKKQNYFTRKAAKCRRSSPSCTQGFNSIACSMTSSAGGSSTAQGGIDAVEEAIDGVAMDAVVEASSEVAMDAMEEASSEVSIDAIDHVSPHTGANGRGEEKTPCSEDADPLAGMDGEASVGEKGSPGGSPTDHVQRRSIPNGAPPLASPSYHNISDNYSAVYSSRKGEGGCHTWRGKSAKLEDSVQQGKGRSTPFFCVPPNCSDKRQDGEAFPFFCYYGCGKDALQPGWRQRQWSVQSEKTMERRMTIRGRGNSVPSEYTCRRRVSSSTDISSLTYTRSKEMVEGMNRRGLEGRDSSGEPLNHWGEEEPRYHWGEENYRGGCAASERVLPKFKSLSNDVGETHSEGRHFANASVGQSKEECYVGNSQGRGVGRDLGRGLPPWGDHPREGQVEPESGDDREVYPMEGGGRIPLLAPSTRMYSREDVKRGDLFVRGGCGLLVPPFKGLKVGYRSSGGSRQSEKNRRQVDTGQSGEPIRGRSGFRAEKDIFFEAIRNIIRIMKEIRKIKMNLKIERNYSLVIQDKEKKNELEKLIDYLTYQKEVRKKLKKSYFDMINKGLFTFLLRSNRANFFFTEEEVKLLKRWNEIKFTKMGSSSGGNTEGEGGRTNCLGRSGGGSHTEGGPSDRRKILHRLRRLNDVIGQQQRQQHQQHQQQVEEEEEEGVRINWGDEAMWIGEADGGLWPSGGYPPGEAPRRGGRPRKSKNMDSLRSGYLGSTPSRPIWYESYFAHCEKSQRNSFNIFLCLKNVKRIYISQRFKRRIQNGQIYLSKIYDGEKMLGHVKYILEELLNRSLPEIVCLHINDCFVDATISFFISLILLLFKNVNTIKVIRCHIYYSYLSDFLAYQKRNNLRSMHFVCNSILWTRPPDFRSFRGGVHSARQRENFLLYFNTNYVKKGKGWKRWEGRPNSSGDATTGESCRREDSRDTSLKSCLRGRAPPSNGAATGDYRIVVKRGKEVARFGVDEFYDCFVLGGREAKGGREANGGSQPKGEDNQKITPNKSADPQNNSAAPLINSAAPPINSAAPPINSAAPPPTPANAYNIHSGSGSDANTSEDSLKEELQECLCTFPRKRIEEANFWMLKKLKLCSNKLNDDALMYICTLIKKDKLKNLKVLDLRWNNFTYRSLLALSLALTSTTVSEASEGIHCKRRKLHKLLLSGNNIKSPLYSSFLSSFCTCNFIVVRKLDFSMNLIDSDSFAITFKYFRHIFQLQKKKPKKKNNIGNVFINLDHNNLKNSFYINKLAHLLKKFPSKEWQPNGETPVREPNTGGEDARKGVLLSLQYNNIKRGTWGEDPGGTTSRIRF
ncbi:hypothetical protein PVMG_00935 [Plasmodium vivax Mauritania I]|uniref:Leucine-rich repeat protein n=1 Tax=Plasmodium vivax Mauritania I TaxID=1035515 RepID=A0A0J9TE87_PLAVI|nr:hypothetical protein PVMG_00935 [Plasmodium vivax Mauritania I]